jgi:adenine-specific DNA-methyltransferase
MDGKSLDLNQTLLNILKAHAPEIFSEDKIDYDRLKMALGEDIFVQGEHYELSWAGKTAARQEIQQRNTATLRLKDQIKDKNHTQTAKNIFIEGENLDVLRTLQKSYFGKVKMIYIDPPYNTGNDSFVYPDNFFEKQADYKRRTGITDEDGNLNKSDFWKKNTKENGQFHSLWLSMMYPRLYMARNLMREDGVIFISIDDNEATNLKLLCDEIFGEENFIGDFVWRRKVGAGADAKLFFRQHEHILFYAKNIINIKELFQPLTEEQKKEYSNPDNDYRGNWAATDLSSPAHDNDPKRIYEVVSPTGKISKKCWAYTKDNFAKLIEDNLIYWGVDGNSMPKRKRFLNDKQGLTPRSWIDNILTQDGKKDLEHIGLDTYFDYPKPIKLIKHFLNISTKPTENALILDFFAGSGTTAQAVLELNEEDGGNRSFILVQMPERTDEKSEAFKAGYKTISDITKARIEKVISKIGATRKGELQLSDKQNLGFSSYILSDSNFKIWRSDMQNTENIAEQLGVFQSSEKSNSSQIDMLAELCLKSGLGLNVAYEVTVLPTDIRIYKVKTNPHELWFCFDAYAEFLKEIIVTHAPKKVFFLNSCFQNNDVALSNLQLELRENDIDLTII